MEIAGQPIALHYLKLLHEHDRLAQNLDFTRLSSIFEIGGGFGVNVHLLLENYPNVRKVVYLDIPPNLYIGTQYLRAFYPEAIQDYRVTRELDRITFKENKKLEILCVAPWQIERLSVPLDLFYNAHSFVEMPEAVVQNYAKFICRSQGYRDAKIALLSYRNFDPESTWDPERLPSFFEAKKFSSIQFSSILSREIDRIAFISV